ncbi:MAG: tyrosine-type recombinase/integrase, partial [Patescibacteria group bacterium]
MTRKIDLPYKDDFLLSLQTSNYSPETTYNYERDLEVFEHFLNQDLRFPFRNITKRSIELYKAYLTSVDRKTAKSGKAMTRLSAGSINRTLSSLRRYLAYLIDMDYASPIAPEAVKLLKMPRRHARVAEFEALVRLIESPNEFERSKPIALRNRAMLETLFSTGMRISELVSLNRDQIDRTGRIFIRGKGKKERFVYITPRAQKHIKAYSSMRSGDHPALFVPYRG